jgi:hypothetical protein
MGDIVRSVAVIGLIVLGLYAFGQLFTQEPESATPEVDYAQIVEQARPAVDFDLLAPASLPAGWKATTARLKPEWWHLGVLTDDEEYLGLEQVTVSVNRAIDRFAEESRADGTAEVAGETWTVRTGPDDRTSYLRRADGVTTVVVGTPSRRVIESYIASLSAS